MCDEQSNQKLWQENKGEHGKCYADDHRNGHDNAKYFIAQFVIQPAFKTVHFLLRFVLFFFLGHLFLCGFHQAAVAIPHRNHKVKAAPYKRALPIPRHFFPVVFFPRFYINRSIRQPACHCSRMNAFHHNAFNQSLSTDFRAVFCLLRLCCLFHSQSFLQSKSRSVIL